MSPPVFYDCEECGRALTGSCQEVLGKLWHSDHFVCSMPKCRSIIKKGHVHFFQGPPIRLFCDNCVHGILAIPALGKKWQSQQEQQQEIRQPANREKCDDCEEEVKEPFVKALGKYFHVHHFKCSSCDKVITGKFATTKKKTAKCYNCFCKAKATCDKCGKIIDDFKMVKGFKGEHWHIDCYTCSECGTKLDCKESTKLHRRKLTPLCPKCFEKSKLICHDCHQPIDKLAITRNDNGDSYHIDCFTCDKCQKEVTPENMGRFNGQDRPLCQDCASCCKCCTIS